MAFNGDVYDGFDARTLKPKQLAYAQSHAAHPVRACTACCARST